MGKHESPWFTAILTSTHLKVKKLGKTIHKENLFVPSKLKGFEPWGGGAVSMRGGSFLKKNSVTC